MRRISDLPAYLRNVRSIRSSKTTTSVNVFPCRIGPFRLTHCKGKHTHPFNGRLSETTQVSRYQKGKTNRDFTEARDSEWQWHQLGHMQICTSLQTDNHANTPPLTFLQVGCRSCRPTNSVKSTEGSTVTGKLFLFFCLELGCPCSQAPWSLPTLPTLLLRHWLQ